MPGIGAVAMVAFTFSDLLGGAVDLVRHHVGRFLATQGVFVLLAGLLGVAASIVLFGSFLDVIGLAEVQATEEAVDPEVLARIALLAVLYPLVLAVVAGVVGIVGSFFGIAAAEALRRGDRPTLGSLWATHRTRFVRFFATALLAMVVPGLVALAPMLFLLFGLGYAGLYLMVLGALVAFPVALVLWLRWWLAPAVALFEQRTVGENLRESARLLRGRYLVVIAALVVVALVSGLVTSLVTVPLALVTGAPAYTPFGDQPDLSALFNVWDLALQQLGGVLVSVVFAPVFSALTLLAYRAAQPPPPPPTIVHHGGLAAPPAPAAAAAAPSTGPSTCARCGATRGAGARFCAVCGTPFPP